MLPTEETEKQLCNLKTFILMSDNLQKPDFSQVICAIDSSTNIITLNDIFVKF